MMDVVAELECIMQHKGQLEGIGIETLGVIKVASDEDYSDLVVVVEFREGAKNFSSFMEAKLFVEDILRRKVEFGTRALLKPVFRAQIDANLQSAF